MVKASMARERQTEHFRALLQAEVKILLEI